MVFDWLARFRFLASSRQRTQSLRRRKKTAGTTTAAQVLEVRQMLSGTGGDYYEYDYGNYESDPYASADSDSSGDYSYSEYVETSAEVISAYDDEQQHGDQQVSNYEDNYDYEYDYNEFAPDVSEEGYDYSSYDEYYGSQYEDDPDPSATEEIPSGVENAESESAGGSEASEPAVGSNESSASESTSSSVPNGIADDFRSAVATAGSQYNKDVFDAAVEHSDTVTSTAETYNNELDSAAEGYGETLSSANEKSSKDSKDAAETYGKVIADAKESHTKSKDAIATSLTAQLNDIEAEYQRKISKARKTATDDSKALAVAARERQDTILKDGAQKLKELDEQYEKDLQKIIDRYAPLFAALAAQHDGVSLPSVSVSMDVYEARNLAWGELNGRKYAEIDQKKLEYQKSLLAAAKTYDKTVGDAVDENRLEEAEETYEETIQKADEAAKIAGEQAAASNEQATQEAFDAYLVEVEGHATAATESRAAAAEARDTAIAAAHAQFSSSAATLDKDIDTKRSVFNLTFATAQQDEATLLEDEIKVLVESAQADGDSFDWTAVAVQIIDKQKSYRDSVASAEAQKVSDAASENASYQQALYAAAAETLIAVAAAEASYKKELNQIDAGLAVNNANSEKSFVGSVAGADASHAKEQIKISDTLSGTMLSAEAARIGAHMTAKAAIDSATIEATAQFESDKLVAELAFVAAERSISESYVPQEQALEDTHWEEDKAEIEDEESIAYYEAIRDLARARSGEISGLLSTKVEEEGSIVEGVLTKMNDEAASNAAKGHGISTAYESAAFSAAVEAATRKQGVQKSAAEQGVPLDEGLITGGAGSLASFQSDLAGIAKGAADAAADADKEWTENAIAAEIELRNQMIAAAEAQIKAEAKAKERAARAEHVAAQRAERDLTYWQGVGQVALGYGDALWAVVEGGAFMVAHPITTVQGVAHAVTHPIDTANLIIEDYSEKTKTLRGQGEIVGELLIEIASGGGHAANGVSAKVCLIRCFTGETEVATPDGPKRIDSIHVGDTVLAQDFKTGEWVPREVLETHENNFEGALVTVETEGDGEEPAAFTATEAHPIWVVSGHDLDKRPACDVLAERESEGLALSGRWVYSHDLRVGDRLASETGEPKRVTKTTQV